MFRTHLLGLTAIAFLSAVLVGYAADPPAVKKFDPASAYSKVLPASKVKSPLELSKIKIIGSKVINPADKYGSTLVSTQGAVEQKTSAEQKVSAAKETTGAGEAGSTKATSERNGGSSTTIYKDDKTQKGRFLDKFNQYQRILQLQRQIQLQQRGMPAGR